MNVLGVVKGGKSEKLTKRDFWVGMTRDKTGDKRLYKYENNIFMVKTHLRTNYINC